VIWESAWFAVAFVAVAVAVIWTAFALGRECGRGEGLREAHGRLHRLRAENARLRLLAPPTRDRR
jgi:hypothetical protein